MPVPWVPCSDTHVRSFGALFRYHPRQFLCCPAQGTISVLWVPCYESVLEISARPFAHQVPEALRECKSMITRPFSEYDFQFFVIIQSTLFLLLSILARKSLTKALSYQF